MDFFKTLWEEPYVVVPALLAGLFLAFKGMIVATAIVVVLVLLLWLYFIVSVRWLNYSADSAWAFWFATTYCAVGIVMSWTVYFLIQLNLSDLFSVLYGAGHSAYDFLLQQWRNGGWVRWVACHPTNVGWFFHTGILARRRSNIKENLPRFGICARRRIC